MRSRQMRNNGGYAAWSPKYFMVPLFPVVAEVQ